MPTNSMDVPVGVVDNVERQQHVCGSTEGAGPRQSDNKSPNRDRQAWGFLNAIELDVAQVLLSSKKFEGSSCVEIYG